ncbi:MAG: MFS transporter, partial [Actinobacteria bacterium]|nr:MFS transporter [Actinomycetota bacterium]
VLLRPDPLALAKARPVVLSAEADEGIVRGRSTLVFAIAALALSHAVMVSVMSMTPVHLADQGASLVVVGFTISLHIAGMYALSPVFGWASDRFGRIRILLVGQLLFVMSIFVVAIGTANNAAVGVGLVLLGLGWSASTVSASALISDLVTGAERVRIQGRSDLFMNIAGAVGGASAGPVLALIGYAGLAWVVGVLVLAILGGATVITQSRRTA